MKETPFRWVDQYLIRLSLKQKFYLLYILIFALTVATGAIFYSAAQAQATFIQEKHSAALNTLLSHYDINSADASQLLEQSGLNVEQVGRSWETGATAISTKVKSDFWSYIDVTSWGFLSIMFLISAMALHYVSSFIGGAMYTMNYALQRMLDGDLTSRMNFFPVRDEFSIIATTVDNIANREHSLVKAIKKCCGSHGATLWRSERSC